MCVSVVATQEWKVFGEWICAVCVWCEWCIRARMAIRVVCACVRVCVSVCKFCGGFIGA